MNIYLQLTHRKMLPSGPKAKRRKPLLIIKYERDVTSWDNKCFFSIMCISEIRFGMFRKHPECLVERQLFDI